MNLPYPVEIVSLQIGKLNVKLAQIKDPEKLFDELLSRGKNHPDVVNENIPYWGELWPSAIGLANFLAEHPELISGKDMLEIGCGLGLPGIVSTLLGGKIILTDYLSEALLFAEYNCRLNFKTTPVLRLLDWRNPSRFSPVDVLIASDIAYESKAFSPLIKAMRTLTKEKGIILLSEPNRGFAKNFFVELQPYFTYTMDIKNVQKDGIDYKISIYTLRKK